MNSPREEIERIQYVYAVPTSLIEDSVNEIFTVIIKEIDRIIEDEKERMITQGHTFSSKYGLRVTEIPVDKVIEIFRFKTEDDSSNS